MKDKNRLPLMIALIAVVAVLAGVAVVKFTGSKAAPPTPTPPPPEQTPVAKPLQEPTDKGPAPDQVEPEPMVIAMHASAPTTQVRRDPFMPTLDVWTKSVPPRPTPGRIRIPPGGVSGMLPPNLGLNFNVGQHQQPDTTGNYSVQTPEQDYFPPFVVTGVITGRTNVAIIRLGESRYICKEGQMINGIYKVVSVSQGGILLSRDGRSVFLKLGGERNAS